MKSHVNGKIAHVAPRAARRLVALTACGGGVFTTLAVDQGRPRHLQEHLKRLGREARAAHLPQARAVTLRSILGAVIRANRNASCVIRLGWLSERGKARPFALCERPRSTPAHVVVQLVPQAGRPLGGYVKSLHGLRWQSLRLQAQRAGVFDVLLVRHGRLSETSRFNVFLELDGRLCTPPNREVFCGIARDLELADARVATRVMPLFLRHLTSASRVLLVNSVRGSFDVSRVVDQGGGTVWKRERNPRARPARKTHPKARAWRA